MKDDLKVKEAARLVIPFKLRYSADWSVASERGDPVPKTATTKVYFYIKEKVGDATAFLTYDDSDETQIAWTDEDGGELNVILGTETEGYVGTEMPWELRAQMSDESWVTLDCGTIEIEPSTVGTP